MIPLWPYTIVLKKDFWNLHRPSSSACRSHIAGRNAQWGPNLDCSLQPRLIMGGNQKNGISQDPPYRPYRNAEKGFSVSKQYERTFKPPRVSKPFLSLQTTKNTPFESRAEQCSPSSTKENMRCIRARSWNSMVDQWTGFLNPT